MKKKKGQRTTAILPEQETEPMRYFNISYRILADRMRLTKARENPDGG